MGAKIHPTAIVDPDARLGEGVELGPYCVIGAGVVLGDGCVVGPHAYLVGPMEMGPDCTVCHSAAVGHDPQVKGKKGPFGGTRIGARCVFREYSQVHRSMYPDGETVIGDDGFFMANCHVAHDCVIGNQIVLCNNSLLSGHVVVGHRALISGNCVVHQFSRIGELSMTGGGSVVSRDIPPFCTVVGGRPARVQGLNVIGLRRAGLPREVRQELRVAYRTIFRSDLPIPERIEAIRSPHCAEVGRLVEFIQSTERGVTGLGGRTSPDGSDDDED